MIYELLYPLSNRFGWASVLNVLRYVPFRIIMATLTAMLLCFFLAPWFIRQLQNKQIGQVKDMGSAAVGVALAIGGLTWLFAIAERIGWV